MEKIIRNYLEIKSLDELKDKKKPNNKYIIEKVSPDDFQLNKFFYNQIGRHHQWNDRLVWDDKKWMDYVSNPNVFTFVLKDNEDIGGFFELIYHKDKSEVEIAYLGLLEGYTEKNLVELIINYNFSFFYEKTLNKINDINDFMSKIKVGSSKNIVLQKLNY